MNPGDGDATHTAGSAETRTGGQGGDGVRTDGRDESGAAPLAPAHSPYRWAMLCGASLIYGSFGMLMGSLAVLVEPIASDLGLSNSAMGTVLGVWQLVYVFLAIPAGAILDRYGLRPSLAIAALALAASAALRAVAVDYATLLAAVAVFGVGGPLISTGAPKLVSRWFAGAERGLAMGIYSSSMVAGFIFALTATNSAIMPLAGMSWRWTYGVYALAALAIALVWLAIAAAPVSRLGNDQRRAASEGLDFAMFAALARERGVRLVLLLGIGIFFFTHSLNAWLPEMLRAQGLSLVAAGYWASLPVAVGMIATLLVPRLAVGTRRYTALAATAVIGIVAMFTLHTEPRALLAGSLVLQGVARSALFPVAMLVLMESRPITSANMGAAAGLFFTAAQIGGMLGPVTVGVLADLGGGYRHVLWLLAGVCAALLPLVAKLRRL